MGEDSKLAPIFTTMKNTYKHTPGPWKAAGLAIYAPRSFNSVFYGRKRDYSNPVATICGNPMADSAELQAEMHDHNGTNRIIMERIPGALEAEANARLIAAAPDLLDALGKIEAINPSSSASVDDLWLAIGEIRKLAAGAIGKANG